MKAHEKGSIYLYRLRFVGVCWRRIYGNDFGYMSFRIIAKWGDEERIEPEPFIISLN